MYNQSQPNTEHFAELPFLLLPWYRQNKRDLPWRQDSDPYHVWVSEIMLQQTRVEAVKRYYIRFIQALPTIQALAAVDDEKLMKLWEGLGYYSRARNLKKAAQTIVQQHHGEFPTDYSEILKLSGIGTYTAGAISSICFNLPMPAIDGNVLRVIARYIGDTRSIDDAKLKHHYYTLLQGIYPKEAGVFTQALMELGAIVCVPNGAPKCYCCPLQPNCIAANNHETDSIPVKPAKKTRKSEAYTVFLFLCGDSVAIRKRPENGLLSGLYEFPNVPGILSTEDAIHVAEDFGTSPCALHKTVSRKHIFTHVEWQMTAIRLDCNTRCHAFEWVTLSDLEQNYPLPTAFRQFITDYEEDS